MKCTLNQATVKKCFRLIRKSECLAMGLPELFREQGGGLAADNEICGLWLNTSMPCMH